MTEWMRAPSAATADTLKCRFCRQNRTSFHFLCRCNTEASMFSSDVLLEHILINTSFLSSSTKNPGTPTLSIRSVPFRCWTSYSLITHYQTAFYKCVYSVYSYEVFAPTALMSIHRIQLHAQGNSLRMVCHCIIGFLSSKCIHVKQPITLVLVICSIGHIRSPLWLNLL